MKSKAIKYTGLKRVTVWIDAKQWKRLAYIIPSGNRSEAIRCFIDRVVSKNLDIAELMEGPEK